MSETYQSGTSNLDALKKAIEDAASLSGGLWFSYLFVLLYFAVAAGAVTHVDLFMENSVKLPFMNIELPLKAFFLLAPLLFIVTHAYILAHFVLLAEKTNLFYKELPSQIKDAQTAEAKNTRNIFGSQLPSNVFVQFLVGLGDLGEGKFGYLLKTIAWTTLVFAPILLLLLLQIQFLPYHDPGITWIQRIVLLADLLLIGWLWTWILSLRNKPSAGLPVSLWGGRLVGFASGLAVLLFSWMVATFPGEWQKPPLSWVAFLEPISIQKKIFYSRGSTSTANRDKHLSNILILSEFNIYEALKIDNPKKVEWRNVLYSVQNRDLKGAIFDRATLQKVVFDDAQLQGANFDYAHLQGASLKYAKLQGMSSTKAELQGVSFDGANLQGAALNFAKLYFASLNGAKLQGASLDFAELHGASLEGARSQLGPFDESTQLQGASMKYAHLEGASLRGANMAALQISGAYVWRTSFLKYDIDKKSGKCLLAPESLPTPSG
ncbi:MAG: pentapeptide repeat-containing protein [Methylocella sp.]